MRREASGFLAALAVAVVACDAVLGIDAPIYDPTLHVEGGAPTPDGGGQPVDSYSPPSETGPSEAGQEASAPDGGAADACADVDVAVDPANCGTCGHSCLAGKCLGGVCQPFALATDQPSLGGLALSATDVYWVCDDLTTPVIGRAPKDGSAPCDGVGAGCTAQGPLVSPDAIFVQPPYVYVGDVSANQIFRYDLDLVAAPTALFLEDAGVPTSLDVLGDDIYWTSRSGTDFLLSGPTDGGSSFTVLATATASVTAWSIADDGTNLYVPISSGGTSSLSEGVYRIAPGAACGDSCAPLATSNDGPYAITVASGWVYWSSLGGSIYRTTLAGDCAGASPCPEVLASLGMSVRGLVVDGSNVYFTCDDGTLRIASTGSSCTGAACTVLAANLGQPGQLVQDQRALYFVTGTLSTDPVGTLMAVAK